MEKRIELEKRGRAAEEVGMGLFSIDLCVILFVYEYAALMMNRRRLSTSSYRHDGGCTCVSSRSHIANVPH